MPLTEYERARLDEIADTVGRIDERTEIMMDDVNRRFKSAHKRIDEVREEARSAARKTGATTGGGAGAAVSAFLVYIKHILS